ncbi:TIGR02452 family protein [Streptomyces halstedii]|uniref:TIGR02452 family protein n=1 Tax=Streptomyces halstedii TaxID=1944 RepID=UPI00345FB435
MSARLRGIARETEDVVAAGRYRTADGREVPIGRALSAALSGTRLYGPEPVDVAVLDTDRTPVFEVTGGYRRLVLGAWGCGVFRNDPAEVAGAFHTLLAGRGRFAGHFEQVVFGILERGPRFPVRDAFTRVFATQFQP